MARSLRITRALWRAARNLHLANLRATADAKFHLADRLDTAAREAQYRASALYQRAADAREHADNFAYDCHTEAECMGGKL